MNFRMVTWIAAGLLPWTSPLAAQEPDWDALWNLMEKFKVKIDHYEQVENSTPSRKRETWTFTTEARPVTLCYWRYLNRPPIYVGKHPSLTSADMGIGLDSGAFGNWYRNNMIRVLIDGKDALAERAASRIETKEDACGSVRFIWELEEKRVLTLSFEVPEDGHAVYGMIDLAGFDPAPKSLSVLLTCYPGGYGYSSGLPSHRWVSTARHDAEVPPESSGSEFPTVPLEADDTWIFYADKYENEGSLALAMVPEEKASGQVQTSNYTVNTTLVYPPNTRRIRMAFYAFDGPNEAARKRFIESLPRESARLKQLPGRTETKGKTP